MSLNYVQPAIRKKQSQSHAGPAKNQACKKRAAP